MNLASIDLNLLVVLDALISEGHVGRAAWRIGRSQPAVSHSLGRLRELLGDPLLVRTGSRMELTPAALALKEPVAETLEQIRRLLVSESFDPATSSRRFRMLMPDHLADILAMPLVMRLHSEAPGVRLEVAPWQSPASLRPERLREIDLCLSCSTDDLAGFERQALFRDTESIVVRCGHPRRSKLGNLESFLAAGHIAVVGRGRTEDPVDTWLREEGYERRIVLVVPSYLQALHAAASTHLVAFVPRRLAETVAARLALEVLQPPIDPGYYQEFLFFPRRLMNDAAALWLRDLVMGIGTQFDSLAVASNL